jgi:predicted nuclease of restriction endonuclease-like RecB superfamily
MLTSDLAVSFRRGDKIYPFLIRTNNAGIQRDAANLVEIFEAFIGETRGALERELEEFIGTGTDYKIMRGLIKLLMDRCEFETSAPAEPVEIRQKVFLEARKSHPVFPGSKEKEGVLERVAEEFLCDKNAIMPNLYADLPAQQRLSSFDIIEPQDLLDRYNLAQAQALLYRCEEMKIRIAPSNLTNYRAIFGWIKHFGLIHSIIGNAANGYEITLTGAASLFHRSQKYGIQMAVFLPALLLCKNWSFRAEIAQKKGKNLFFELSGEQTEIISNRVDDAPYENPDIGRLQKNWEKFASDWQLKENREVIDLGKTAFVPDLVLISPRKEKIFLDILGFWTPKSLQKRLEEFASANFKKFIIAASNELRGSREEFLKESPNVIFYKTKIEPLLLIEMAERLISG